MCWHSQAGLFNGNSIQHAHVIRDPRFRPRLTKVAGSVTQEIDSLKHENDRLSRKSAWKVRSVAQIMVKVPRTRPVYNLLEKE